MDALKLNLKRSAPGDERPAQPAQEERRLATEEEELLLSRYALLDAATAPPARQVKVRAKVGTDNEERKAAAVLALRGTGMGTPVESEDRTYKRPSAQRRFKPAASSSFPPAAR